MNKENGFTLLEVLVSIVLFTIGVLGMMGLQVLATRGAVIGNNNTIGNYLAQSLAGELQGLPFTAQALSSGSHGYGNSNDACLFCADCMASVDTQGSCNTGGNNIYQVSWVVTPIMPFGSTTQNLLSIAIKISWANGSFTYTVPAAHY
ncbi:MAG: prepilin-type N-terminal cleavage/methylation domain-containing protein [Deltaproteobacteria bacterium]|nr:prepilin-type N-terminal cleavage/methylation domain-containing protein [Deltaproteobacteria bacterium]MCL5276453.1 prepilin-type N-terminal cleavage/methylation domain-containing protein [Deltaproteobacteria bacterium]